MVESYCNSCSSTPLDEPDDLPQELDRSRYSASGNVEKTCEYNHGKLESPFLTPSDTRIAKTDRTPLLQGNRTTNANAQDDFYVTIHPMEQRRRENPKIERRVEFCKRAYERTIFVENMISYKLQKGRAGCDTKADINLITNDFALRLGWRIDAAGEPVPVAGGVLGSIISAVSKVDLRWFVKGEAMREFAACYFYVLPPGESLGRGIDMMISDETMWTYGINLIKEPIMSRLAYKMKLAFQNLFLKPPEIHPSQPYEDEQTWKDRRVQTYWSLPEKVDKRNVPSDLDKARVARASEKAEGSNADAYRAQMSQYIDDNAPEIARRLERDHCLDGTTANQRARKEAADNFRSKHPFQ